MQELIEGYLRSEELGREFIEQIADYLANVSLAGVARYAKPFPVERVSYAEHIALKRLFRKKAIIQRQKDAVTAVMVSKLDPLIAYLQLR